MSQSLSDSLLLWTVRIIAVVTGTIVILIGAFLFVESVPALRHIGIVRFFSDSSWHPAVVDGGGSYNLSPMLTGTLLAMTGAVAIAAPLGILSAAFCRYYAPPILAPVYRALIGLLAGIPSVVYGLWGLVVLVPKIQQLHPPGPSLLAGIIILAIMILPTIALMTDAAFAAVPPAHLFGSAALGLSRWTMLNLAVLPSAKSGIAAGIILGAGRAIGETMAILMVCGNIVQTPKSLFDPIRTLTANIALEMAYAVGDHRSSLFVSGLILMILITVLVILAEVTSGKTVYGSI